MEVFLTLQGYTDWSLLALRIVLAGIFLTHGLPKWRHWRGKPAKDTPRSMRAVMRLLAIAEPLGAIAVAIGLFTQAAALGFVLVMVGAIWSKIKWGVPFTGHRETGWEFDLLILAASLVLACGGAGTLALDAQLMVQ